MDPDKLELQPTRSNSSKIKRKGNVKRKPNEDLLNKYWSENYHKEIEQVNGVNFDELERKFENHRYLPSIPHDRLHSLDHLVYLSSIKKTNANSPFTKKQQSTFDRNRHLKVRTAWCFKFNLVIIIFTALIALLNFVTFSRCDYFEANSTDCLSAVATVSIPTIFNLATILLLGIVSLYATGILPDQSSESSNKVQDKIRAIHEEYLTLAKYWVDVHFECPQKSQELVDRFDFEELKLRMKVKLGSKVNHYLTNPLEEAFNFIRTGSVLLTFTEIENYLYHKIMSRRLCDLEARLVSPTTVQADESVSLINSQENLPDPSLSNNIKDININNSTNINDPIINFVL